jgi:hypothetical protein
MPISRLRAMERLLNFHAQCCIDDSTYQLRVTIADLWQHEIIDIVIRDNLLEAYDSPEHRIGKAIEDFHRDQTMLKAWLGPRSGGVQ